MVKAIVNIDEHTNRVLNIIKAKYGLKDKSQALNTMAREFCDSALEPELRPEFIKKIERIEKKGKFIKVENFAKRYGLKK